VRNQESERERGYARRFEYRPEFLFCNLVKKVIDANVQERTVNDFRVARVEDVFDNYNETFIVFGRPNTALVTALPDGTGYQKFAAYSLWRKAAHIENITRNSGSFLQSGIWLRLLNLPPSAQERVRKEMDKLSGEKFRTCVNGTMQVLESAGFSSKSKKLSAITWPYQLMSVLLEGGLLFDGEPIGFEVIRTTRMSMEEYTRGIILAEIATPYRHFKKHPLGAKLHGMLTAPFRGLKPVGAKKSELAEVAPALPVESDYLKDIQVRVTAAPLPGRMLRQLWGPHALFEAMIDRISADDYFQKALKPFSQENPGFATRVKKTVLFSKPVIWLMRKIMGASAFHEIGTCSERDIYDMLRTHSEASENKYNIVAVRKPASKPKEKPATRLIISRITVRNKLVDWILSKHVLVSGYLWSPGEQNQQTDKTKPYVVWAGELWKDPSGKIICSGNSGTYRPGPAEDDAMAKFLQAALPNLKIEKFSR